MKHGIAVGATLGLVTLLNSPAHGAETGTAQASSPLKVLIITGGHGFDQEPFFKMFQENSAIRFTHAEHAGTNATAYERADLLDHDVLVLYDMAKSITDAQKARLMSVCDKGIGLLFLHHALAGYQQWPDYERLLGGHYLEPDPDKPGKVTDAVGWQHDVDIPVVITDPLHPITHGVLDFTIHDEIYWGFRVRPDVTPLLTTTHPKSGRVLGWSRTEGKSRIAYIQLGHGASAFNHPSYRKLVSQGIQWVANRGQITPPSPSNN